MGLGSVMQTAISGMSAAESMVAAIANNLANLQTRGFKASNPMFATQQPQTLSLGASPGGGSGGANPIQIGLGVQIAADSTNFSQGSLVMEGGPMNLAVQGDGFFILDGPNGQRSYTRDGSFRLNADRQLVSADGYKVLGYKADNNFQIQTGELKPIEIPLGKTIATESGGTATLTGFQIGEDGVVNGTYSDGQFRSLGQIRMARFANASGLQKQAGNRYTVGPDSGLPMESDPEQAGVGQLVSGATELSNTDVAASLTGLISASTMFRANLSVIDTASLLLDELTSLSRR